jgi:hypothetical protein
VQPRVTQDDILFVGMPASEPVATPGGSPIDEPSSIEPVATPGGSPFDEPSSIEQLVSLAG